MFIKLTLVGCTDVYVNVNNITRIYRLSGATHVYFNCDDYCVVKESPEEITNRIQKYRGEL